MTGAVLQGGGGVLRFPETPSDLKLADFNNAQLAVSC